MDQYDELRHNLMFVAQKIRRIGMGAALGNLLHSEYMLLQKIYHAPKTQEEKDGVRVSELAEGLHLAPSAVSRLLSSMEEKGLVAREVSRNDRRNTYVSITEEGERQRKLTADNMKLVINRVIERMGTEEIEKLIGLWEMTSNIMQEEMDRFGEEYRAKTERQEHHHD